MINKPKRFPLQVDAESKTKHYIDMRNLRRCVLPNHGLHHGLQGSLCFGISPSFLPDLTVCWAVSLTFSHSHLVLLWSLPVPKCHHRGALDITHGLSFGQQQVCLGLSWSWLWRPTDATPAARPLPTALPSIAMQTAKHKPKLRNGLPKVTNYIFGWGKQKIKNTAVQNASLSVHNLNLCCCIKESRVWVLSSVRTGQILATLIPILNVKKAIAK